MVYIEAKVILRVYMGTKRLERAREKKYTGPAACQAPHWRRIRVRSRGEAEARLWLVESEQKGVLEAAAQIPRREVEQEKDGKL